MGHTNGSSEILERLGYISGRLDGISIQQERDGRRLDTLTVSVARLEQQPAQPPQPAGRPFWFSDRFWLAVMATGAALAGSPELAKMLLH